jgi:hypothetical protein
VKEEGKLTGGNKLMCHKPEEVKKWRRKDS